MIEMDPKEVEQLAFDVACAYFKDDQLCIRYDLTLTQLASVREQRPFLKAVDEVRRLLNDDGSEFVIAAKKMSMGALRALEEITNDKLTSDNARIKAAAGIFSMAKLLHLPTKNGDGAAVGSLIINTNLQLNQDPAGVYTIEAQAEAPAIEYKEAVEYPLIGNSDLL